MGRLRRSVLVLILLGLSGLASTAALGQSIGDLSTVTSNTAVTPTLTEVVSGVTGETPLVESGGGTSGGAISDVGDSSSGATAPITSTASSLTGKSGTGSIAETPKEETRPTTSQEPSIQTMSCGEASRDPQTLGAFLLTLKEGERGAPGSNGTAGSGVLGATGGDGQQEAAPSLPMPPAVPDEPDGFPTWLGIVALAALALGFAALLALVAKSFFAERQVATPSLPSGSPTSGGAVRRSL